LIINEFKKITQSPFTLVKVLNNQNLTYHIGVHFINSSNIPYFCILILM
jgi:hypothetical protein